MQGLVELMLLVTVGEGILEGELVQNEFGGSFYSYKGIPYAQPPVGDLRFKAPQPPTPWEGVRNATQHASTCYQFDVLGLPSLPTGREGSEDCLYLNVYTPNPKPDKLLPVMFWIHGGEFKSGSGDDGLYGPEFLIREDVVIVTFNYRLEVLGFLSLETEDVPGNAGMKDQVAALKWVIKNISQFGGDPEQITIFGESAGGASVSYHLISPMTKGLFKRAIVQSGSATNSWAQAFKPRQRALALARQLGFYSENDKELYEFFKNQPAETLVGAFVPITIAEMSKLDTHTPFSIAIEKDFGQERFFTGDFTSVHEDVEIMLGYTSEEGIVVLGTEETFDNKMVLARDFPEFFLSMPLTLTMSMNEQMDIGRKIRKFYFNDTIDLTGSWQGMLNFYSMDMFQFEIVQFAKNFAEANKVYLYRFSCKTERNIMSFLFGVTPIIGNTPVTAHGDDLMYLFNFKSLPLPLEMDSDTFRLIESVVKLWTNFAKYGNPTPDASLGAIWKPYTLEDQDYFEIANEFFASTAPDNEDVLFWESINNITHTTVNSGMIRSYNTILISSCLIYIMYVLNITIV